MEVEKTRFYNFGKYLYRYRILIILLWIAAIIACVPFAADIIKPFKTTGFIDENSESAITQKYIDKELGFDSKNKFIVLYTSDKLKATGKTFQNKIKKSLSGLKNFPIEHEIIYPKDSKKQISKDKHSAFAVIIVKSEEPLHNDVLQKFKDAIKKPTNMKMYLGGDPIFVESVNEQTQDDLYRADLIAAPLAVIVLLLVFKSVIAALMPIVLGGAAAFIMLNCLFFLGHMFTLSVFTINIALLLGLCLTLDYTLFIIYRFREELDKKVDVIEAIAITQKTAGKAIFFSGLAVFTSISALLFFPVNILFSMAIGGLTAVFVSVLTSIILLPAILSVLKHKINLLPITLSKKPRATNNGVWHKIATTVVNWSRLGFVFMIAFLLVAGYPFLSAKVGISDYHILPDHSKHRDFYDNFAEKFGDNELSPIVIALHSKPSRMLSPKNTRRLYNFARKLQNNPLVKQVDSIVTTSKKISKNQYYRLYNMPKKHMNKAIKVLLDTTTRKHFTTLSVTSKYPTNSPETKKLINDIEDTKAGWGMTKSLTGTPVNNMDVLDSIYEVLPFAILWIIVLTYIILLVLLRSLFLPFKAIIINILSLSACYGALVLVFQDGYLHNLLDFDPQGMVDISILVIIFCTLFGFSIDYEVFLLTRIRESYQETKDTKNSIIFGIEKSSRIITSAAIIVIFICLSFLVAHVIMVKAFGLGIAVAIFIDAFLIRTVLVPATMALFASWNWYIPKWLDKALPKI